MPEIQPRRFSGTRDFLPVDMIPREDMFAVVKRVFARFGYDPLETPAIEHLDVLSGKYGPEAEKLIYTLNYKSGTKDAAGLRYDLTVPLCRVVAMAAAEINLPFRRYQVQPVWRAERAQVRQGRYREFYQCDADCVGSSSLVADAEIVTMIAATLAELGLADAVVRVNHRKLLRHIVLFLGLGLEREFSLLRCIDKYDKIGAQGVHNELLENGFTQDEARGALELFSSTAESPDPLIHLGMLLGGDDEAVRAIGELGEMMNYVRAFGMSDSSVRFDIWMVRGLDYYTGPIFEAVLPSLPHMGSLAGGGRYDGLIGMFLGRDIPATGATVGLDRIFTALEQLGKVRQRVTRAEVLIAVFDAVHVGEALAVATQLRSVGIDVAVYPEADKLKKQFRYADRLGVRFTVLVGPDEAASGTAVLKDLFRGEQVTLLQTELAPAISKMRLDGTTCRQANLQK